MATNLDPSKKLITTAYSRELLKCLQDYRFAGRFPSIASAIRSLVVEGLLKNGALNLGPGEIQEAPGPDWDAVVKDGVLTGWLGPEKLTEYGKAVAGQPGTFSTAPHTEE